ncbi:MAG: hypothetical protein PHE89_02680 [Alphaproteobacteria bacterium]|nr:hypothetical protein [Alphaproteobacteria bacterium]
MSTNKSNNLTLLDQAQREDPDGKVSKVVEVLVEKNEMLEDAIFVKCNDKTGHKTTIRSGLPQGTWRKLNYGVKNEKSKTAQIRDTTGMLESYSEIDKALADLSGNVAEFRASEDVAFIEGMAQTLSKALIYGDSSVNPEKIMGFAPRFSSKSAGNGGQIIDAGGTGPNLTSMWLIGWGDLTVHCIFPEGSKAGMQVEDKGVVTISDGNGGQFDAYRTKFKFDAGLTVRDWRYVVRIANIPTTGLTNAIFDKINEALDLIPNLSGCKPVFYCNRKLKTALRNIARTQANVQLSVENVNGKAVQSYDGVPVKRVDEILSTESQVQ